MNYNNNANGMGSSNNNINGNFGINGDTMTVTNNS